MSDGNFQVQLGEILIVDDLSENLQTLSAILKHDKYKVRLAQSGPQALKSVKMKEPDLILLDIRMPEMDGYEVCQKLKHDENSREIPVIFISALNEAMDKVKAFEVGGVDYIAKPFNSEEVIARIDTHLQLRQLQKKLQKYSHSLEKEVSVRTAELEESREDYSRLVENLPVGIFRTVPNNDSNFQMANPAMAEMFGFETVEELMEIPVVDLYQNAADRQHLFAKLSKNEFVRNEEFAFRSKTGKSLIVSVSAHLIRGRDGKPLYIDGVVQDITERKKLESQFRQAQKMEAIGTLASGIAHDFNNILGAIFGYAELAKEDAPKGSSILNDLSEILNAAHRAKDLTAQILTFSRQREVEPKPVQVKLIVKEALKLLKASFPSTISIKPALSSDSLIMADPTEVHQVIMNICTNAGHAMQELQEGILDVQLNDVEIGNDFAAAHQINPGCYQKLSIKDNGGGIKPEIMESIFDPFFTTKSEGEGTGLGLSVVHGIVKNFKGAITIDSQLGKGTTFNVYWPVIHIEDAQQVIVEQALPRGTESILYVDDDQMLMRVTKESLRRLGYKVTAMESSTEALELFMRNPSGYDLVLTDLTMPNMTGDILSKKILETRSDIPIILCTGYSNVISNERALAIGIKKFIMKPLRTRELAFALRDVLAQSNS